MNVFADFHHTDLMHSLYLLFEKRLGANLYRPIGLDWWRAGYWRYMDLEPTVHQFLSVNQGLQNHPDGTHPLNVVDDVVDGVYYVEDRANGTVHKAVTLDTFKKMDIDVVVASVPQHWHTFAKLIAEHKPRAKLVCQVGNQWNVDPALCKNVLASVKPVIVHAGVNYVFYHQEFDLDIFRYEPPTPGSRLVTCFVNVYHEKPAAYREWQKYRELVPDFEFRLYGAQNEHGCLGTHQDIARAMRESAFIWHVKPGGDGFGHVVHNAFACGRPVVTRRRDYAGKLAGDLMLDGATCVDLDARGAEQAVALMRAVAGDPDWHARMCQAARARFDEVVDFDAEEGHIRAFLERLL